MHLLEEIWAGQGFVSWASHHLSSTFTLGRFISINAITWPAMLVASFVAIRAKNDWLVASMAGIVLLNGVLHLASTAATGTYSPGTISGVVLYIPLGAFGFRSVLRHSNPRALLVGLTLAVVIHVAVALSAFGIG